MLEHPGSKDTYEHIAQWIAGDFFFSEKDRWDRMGMLGVFGDYVLSCTQGDVLEIGVGESSIYLSHAARKYNRNIYHCDISPSKTINPLTIDGYLTPQSIDVEGEHSKQRYLKSGNSHFYMDESDNMFRDIGEVKLALAFIDGDHIYEQAKKDFCHIVPLMSENGYIFLHDTYPPNEEYLSENACGDVYRLRKEIEADDRFDCITLTRGAAMGVGLTIVRIKPIERAFYNE